jgi:hypothetical protein
MGFLLYLLHVLGALCSFSTYLILNLVRASPSILRGVLCMDCGCCVGWSLCVAHINKIILEPSEHFQ